MKSGLVLINKEKNISSQKVDTIIKKKFNVSKVGHLGTLDPLAEGLLVVGINRGTRFFKYLENTNKEYILRIRIGATSKSLDYESELENITSCNLKGKEEYIDKLLKEFNRDYYQVPPIYSAIKVDGIPLYKYAINNKDVDIKTRHVKIYELKRISEIVSIDNQSYFDIYMHVSKGFYVRSFSKEFGDILNIPSMADNIKRVGVGRFKIEDSIKIDDIDNLDEYINDPLEYLEYKRVELNEKEYNDVLVGKQLEINLTDEYVILTYNNEFVSIYKYDNDIKKYRMDLVNLK